MYGRKIIKTLGEEIANVSKSLTRRVRHQFKVLNDFMYLLGE